jgi:hypothetical protein
MVIHLHAMTACRAQAVGTRSPVHRWSGDSVRDYDLSRLLHHVTRPRLRSRGLRGRSRAPLDGASSPSGGGPYCEAGARA